MNEWDLIVNDRHVVDENRSATPAFGFRCTWSSFTWPYETI